MSVTSLSLSPSVGSKVRGPPSSCAADWADAAVPRATTPVMFSACNRSPMPMNSGSTVGVSGPPSGSLSIWAAQSHLGRRRPKVLRRRPAGRRRRRCCQLYHCYLYHYSSHCYCCLYRRQQSVPNVLHQSAELRRLLFRPVFRHWFRHWLRHWSRWAVW